jgi:hypothetical protein
MNKPKTEKILLAISEFQKTRGKEPKLIRVTLDDFVYLQQEGAWSPSQPPSINNIPVEWSPNLNNGNMTMVQ